MIRRIMVAATMSSPFIVLFTLKKLMVSESENSYCGFSRSFTQGFTINHPQPS